MTHSEPASPPASGGTFFLGKFGKKKMEGGDLRRDYTWPESASNLNKNIFTPHCLFNTKQRVEVFSGAMEPCVQTWLNMEIYDSLSV